MKLTQEQQLNIIRRLATIPVKVETPAEFYDVVFAHGRLLNADIMVLYLWDEAAEKFFAAAAYGIRLGRVNDTVSFKQSTNDRIWTGTSQKETFTWNPLPDDDENRVAAALCLPLKDKQHLAGWLFAARRPDLAGKSAAFSKEELTLFHLLIERLSQTLTYFNLFRFSQHQATCLNVTAKISQIAASALDLNELMNTSVNLIQEDFQLYYVGLFLLDEKEQWAVLHAGTGEVGKKQIADNHRLKVGGNSLIGYATSTGEGYLALDIGKDSVHFKNPHLPDTYSEMALPMHFRGRIMGALTIQSREINTFKPGDLQVFQTMADQLAAALENTRLLKSWQEQEQIASTLRDIGMALAGNLNLEGVLSSILEQVTRVIEYDSASVWLDMGDEKFRCVAQRGYERFDVVDRAKELEFAVTPEGNPLMMTLHDSYRPVIIPDVSQDSRWSVIEGFEWIKSWAFAPIVIDGQLIGQFVLDHSQAGFYTPDYESILETLGTQISIAVRNARLFEQEKLQRQQIEAVQRTSFTLTASLNLPDVLSSILEAIYALQDVVEAAIFLYDADKEILEVGVTRERDGHKNPRQPRKNGLTYSVARSGKEIYIPDRRTHPLYENVPPDWQYFLSIVGLPLKIQERVVGAMMISHPEKNAFEESKLIPLRLLADQAAIAIENARLYTLEQKRRRISATLAEIARAVNSTLDLNSLLRTSLEKLGEVLNYDTASIHLLEGGQQILAAGRGFEDDEAIVGTVFPIDEDLISHHIMRDQKTRVIKDAQKAEGWGHKQAEEVDEIAHIHGWIGAPLVVEGKSIGLLAIDSLEVGAYNDEDGEIATAFANQIATAIQNARLYRVQQQQRQLADILRDINIQLTGSLVKEEVLAAIPEQVKRALPYDVLSLWLIGEDGKYRIAASGGYERLGVAGVIRYLSLSDDDEPIKTLKSIPHDEIIHASDETSWIGRTGMADLKSWIGAPIVLRGQFMGVLTLNHHRQNFYTPEHDIILKMLATQISIAIENAGLFNSEQQQRQLTATIQEISMVLTGNLRLEDLLHSIMEQIGRVLPYTAASIWLLDEDNNFRVAACVGYDRFGIEDEVLALEFPADAEGLIPGMRHTGKMVIIPDVHKHPDWVVFEGFEWQRSWAAAPIKAQGEVIGAVAIDHMEPHFYGSHYKEILEALTVQISIAVKNARLYQQSLDYARQMEIARQFAEASSRSKSTFLANMSHELRTPLNAIIGYTALLIDGTYGEFNEKQVHRLQRVVDNGKHLLSLINDILDLSKIEAGKMELDMGSFDVRRMVNAVVESVQPLMENNRNKLTVRKEKNPGTMYADRTRVHQIIQNLLSNAAKFTEDGDITLTVKRAIHDEEACIEFTVTDTGIGMTEEQIEKIFMAFTQADPSTTRKYGGTGLGLAISQRFCQMMGGNITVSSELGKGSTFTFWIPVEVKTPSVPIPPPATVTQSVPTLRPSQDSTILVIDDDPAVREMMEHYLHKEGFRVVTASGGEDGLRQAQKVMPSVITLDIKMPDIDGWTVLTRLKNHPTLSEVPVIILTMLDNRQKGYALGATHYLTKPIDREQLLKIIRRYCCDNPPCPILVVEDNKIMREVLHDTLEMEGITVTEARHGKEALQKIQENRPLLILLDLMMPEMDGFEFLEHLRSNEAWRNIPVVVITAMELTDYDRQRLNSKIDRIIQKGAYNRHELLQQVRDLLAAYV